MYRYFNLDKKRIKDLRAGVAAVATEQSSTFKQKSDICSFELLYIVESKKNSIEAGKTCDMKSGGGCNKLLLYS